MFSRFQAAIPVMTLPRIPKPAVAVPYLAEMDRFAHAMTSEREPLHPPSPLPRSGTEVFGALPVSPA